MSPLPPSIRLTLEVDFRRTPVSDSIRISSQSIMFGTWTTCGFASIVFDSWWFGLMVSRKGFDLLEPSRKGISVAFCVYSGFYAVYRLIVMLFV